MKLLGVAVSILGVAVIWLGLAVLDCKRVITANAAQFAVESAAYKARTSVVVAQDGGEDRFAAKRRDRAEKIREGIRKRLNLTREQREAMAELYLVGYNDGAFDALDSLEAGR